MNIVKIIYEIRRSRLKSAAHARRVNVCLSLIGEIFSQLSFVIIILSYYLLRMLTSCVSERKKKDFILFYYYYFVLLFVADVDFLCF